MGVAKWDNTISDFFPYPTMRDIQAEVLDTIEANWDRYDGFFIVAPTASGKSALAYTIASWSGEYARIITPTNLLVDQYSGSLPIPGLRGYDTYMCNSGDGTETCKERGCTNPNCSLGAAKEAWWNSDIGVTNYHLHTAICQANPHHNAPQVLIADEAHNLIPFLQDWHSTFIWKHQYGFPMQGGRGTLVPWLETLHTHAPRTRIGRHRDILADLTSEYPNYVYKEGEEFWRAGGVHPDGFRMKRGELHVLPTLQARPLDVSRYGSTVWPDRTRKLILLSATISRRDVVDLGLGRRRMMQINCAHPIPSSHRPIIYDPVEFVKHNNLEQATQKIVEHVEKHMLPHHEGEKGLIHATYEQSTLIRKYRTSGRFVFHTAANKAEVYDAWQESDPAEGLVLIACGMYEGLDLPEDLGRWQVLAKIPWPSLLEPAIAYRAEKDEDWYQWTTLKDTIQAAGRICRTPDDYGVTYICDATFEYLKENPNIPSWFLDAVEEYK